MSKNIIYFISAIIFLTYGLLTHKTIFIILGIVFGVIGVADFSNIKENEIAKKAIFFLTF